MVKAIRRTRRAHALGVDPEDLKSTFDAVPRTVARTPRPRAIRKDKGLNLSSNGTPLAGKKRGRPPKPKEPVVAAPVEEDVEDDEAYDAVIDGADKDSAIFKELQRLALQDARRILKMKLVASDKNFNKLLSSKQAIIASVLSTAVRTGAEQLRGKGGDKMQDLLDAVKAEQAALGPQAIH